jgi:hypothetical protein
VAVETLTEAITLKLQRAEEHIADIQRRVDAYLREANPVLMVRTDHQAGEKVAFVKTDVPIPDQLSVVVGDAVHNMRSSLDIAMWFILSPILSAHSPKSLDRIGFPFGKNATTAQEYRQVLDSANVGLAGKRVYAAFEHIAAYPNGNELLCALNALNLTDKHRLILTTARTVTLTPRELELVDPHFIRSEGDPDEPTRFIRTDRIARMKYEYATLAERLAYQSIPPVEHKSKFQPTFEVGFGVGETFEGQHLVGALRGMLRETAITHLTLYDAMQDHDPAPASGAP